MLIFLVYCSIIALYCTIECNMYGRIIYQKCGLTRRCDCTWWCGRLFGWGVGMCAPWWYTDTGSCLSGIGVPALCFPKSAAKASALESKPSCRPLFKPPNKSPWNTKCIIYHWLNNILTFKQFQILYYNLLYYNIHCDLIVTHLSNFYSSYVCSYIPFQQHFLV